MMELMEAPTRTWKELIKAKRSNATFRITLTVRGRRIVKEYAREEEFRVWRDTYLQQRLYPNSGIESVEDEVLYR